MSEKILSNSLIEYPLSKFISDLIKDCMKNFLNSDDCFSSNASQKLSLNSTTVLAYDSDSSATPPRKKMHTNDSLSNFIHIESAKTAAGNPGAAINNCLLLDKVRPADTPLLDISGPRDDVQKANHRVILNSNVPELSDYLTDLLEFYK